MELDIKVPETVLRSLKLSWKICILVPQRITDGDVNIHDTHLVNVAYDCMAEFDANGVEIDLAPIHILELLFGVSDHTQISQKSKENGPKLYQFAAEHVQNWYQATLL